MFLLRIFIALLFIQLLISGKLFAAEIMVEPIVKYTLMGGDYSSYESMEAFKTNYNANQELIFNKCKSRIPYSCAKFLVTTWYPYGTAMYHGEPNWYLLDRVGYYESMGINGIVLHLVVTAELLV